MGTVIQYRKVGFLSRVESGRVLSIRGRVSAFQLSGVRQGNGLRRFVVNLAKDSYDVLIMGNNFAGRRRHASGGVRALINNGNGLAMIIYRRICGLFRYDLLIN